MNLAEQLERLRQDFAAATMRPHGDGYWLEVDQLPLPSGWAPSPSRLAVEVPATFPATKPDGFWIEPGLQAPPVFPQPPGGGEARYGRSWGKVCYQVQGWQPERETLWRYVKAMLRYFAEAR